MRRLTLYSSCVLIVLIGISLGRVFSNPPAVDAARISMKKPPAPLATTTSAVFVGDVMLARHVEKHMRERGLDYPFVGMEQLQASSSYVIGNFEGTIPQVHVPTRPMTFAFSVASTSAHRSVMHGFTHFSLANNHAQDFGDDAYAHTQTTLRAFGAVVGGHPTQVRAEDVSIVNLGAARVAIVPLHATLAYPSLHEVEQVLHSVATSSDIQIAYIHWGNEYVGTHSRAQEVFAHALIDRGIDVIVGHHPHVVQDIGMYRGAPIFYSLGNFIFDQYWNDAVRTGLAVRFAPTEAGLSFEMIPTWSERSNPMPMEGVPRARFLATLAGKSSPLIAPGIIKGRFEVAGANLASYPQQ